MADTVLQIGANVNASELIKYYSANNFTCEEVAQFLCNHHRIPITVRRVKYLKSKNGIKKYQHITDADLDEMIKNELATTALSFGYRQMKYKLH